MKKQKSGKIFLSKLLYSLMIVVVYCIAQKIPLYGVDLSTYGAIENENVTIAQIIGGNANNCSIMAIGIMPLFISGLVTQIIQALRGSDTQRPVRQSKVKRFSLIIMVLLSLVMGMNKLNSLTFVEDTSMFPMVKTIAVIEMVTGAILLVWLGKRNSIYGIGGQSLIILVNIIEGLENSIFANKIISLRLPVMLTLAFIALMLFMENGEKRIPLQRISIHNIYADKNYQSIKFNPIGVMPAMFAAGIFMLPQMMVEAVWLNYSNNPSIIWLHENMSLNKELGLAIYIVIIFLINYFFTLMTINPKDISEQLLKSGDSIVNIRSGKATRKYLRRNILTMTFISSAVMSICLAGAILLKTNGIIKGGLADLPTSSMMLIGIFSRIYREAESIINMDSYKAFI